MRPKNVMLLGFVNKAVEYLDAHMDDDTDGKLSELRNIDFPKLKDELSESIGSSLGTMQSTINTLLHAGEEAFSDFIEVDGKKDLSQQLDDLFTSDLTLKSEKSESDSLESLLKYYDLDPLFDDADSIVAQDEQSAVSTVEAAEEVKDEELPQEAVTEPVQENVIEKEKTEETVVPEVETAQAVEKEKAEEAEAPVPAGLLDEDIGEEQKREEALLELLKQQDNNEDETVQDKPKDEGPSFEMSAEDSLLFDQIAKNVTAVHAGSDHADSESDELDSIFSEVLQNGNDETVPVVEQPAEPVETAAEEEVPEENTPTYTFNPLGDIEVEAEPEKPEQNDLTYDQNDIVAMVQEIQNSKDQYFGKMPSVEELEKAREEEKHPKAPVYVNPLLDELKEKMEQEDELKRRKEEEYLKIYEKIHAIYPYLDNELIRSVYELKDQLAEDYPAGIKIIILHRISFSDVEKLRQFVEIALKHNYSINADEKKLIVDVFKEYVNADGKIMTSLFEVANQGAYLNGVYEGYRVILEK